MDRTGLHRDTVMVAVLSSGRTTMDTLGKFEDRQWFRVAGPFTGGVPFAPALCIAVGDSLVLAGNSERYRITMAVPATRSRRTVSRDRQAAPLSADAMEQFRDQASTRLASGARGQRGYPWLVLGPDGRPVATASLSVDGEFFPTEIGSDYVAGSWFDSDGISHARLYRLIKSDLPSQ